MGAWGTGSFDNDEALDWVGELKTMNPADLQKMLAIAADDPEYLVSSNASEAIAAAEVVAALAGAPAGNAPKEIGEWVGKNPKALTPPLKDAAVRAVDRVRRNSELKDLWLEADGLNDWIESVKELQSRLGN